MKIFSYGYKNINSWQKKLLLELRFEEMFDLRELKLMFLDPTDLLIKKINRLLNNNRVIKFIFS